MGYWVSHMIGINTGGVFSPEADVTDVRARIMSVMRELAAEGEEVGIPDLEFCSSTELVGPKGGCVVIAGTFNSWIGDSVDEFCRRLSVVFGTVMHMEWDMESGGKRSNVWSDGVQMELDDLIETLEEERSG